MTFWKHIDALYTSYNENDDDDDDDDDGSVLTHRSRVSSCVSYAHTYAFVSVCHIFSSIL